MVIGNSFVYGKSELKYNKNNILVGPVNSVHDLTHYENILDGDYAVYLLHNKNLSINGEVEYAYEYVLITAPDKLNLSFTCNNSNPEPLEEEDYEY